MNHLLRIVFSPFNSVITTVIVLFDGTVETCRRIKFSLGSGTLSEMSEYMQMVQHFFLWRIERFVDRLGAIRDFLFRA